MLREKADLPMPIGYNLVPDSLNKEKAAISAGLYYSGYEVSTNRPQKLNNFDVVVMWNRWNENEKLADKLESQGGNVIIAENGYLGTDYIALARSEHNGGGWIPYADLDRLEALQINFKPYRTDGEHILVCPSRGFGSKKMRQPINWTHEIVQELRNYTTRPIYVREHPGNWKQNNNHLSLAEDLDHAWACVIWNSGAGIHSLMQGIPVICCADYWILKDIASDIQFIENPAMLDRYHAFNKLAWSQWSIDEIVSGEPFIRFSLC